MNRLQMRVSHEVAAAAGSQSREILHVNLSAAQLMAKIEDFQRPAANPTRVDRKNARIKELAALSPDSILLQ
jgi:hypothetical protein